MEKIKIWAVVWTEKGMEEYGVPDGEVIVSVEPKEEIRVNVSKTNIGRPKIRYTNPLAIFPTEKEAEAYREGNFDWKVVPFFFEPIL